MNRIIDIINNRELLNPWIKRSIILFHNTSYLDNIQEIYSFQLNPPKRLDNKTRREIIQSHQSRDTEKLLDLLIAQFKFPYEDPMWYLLKNVQNCLVNNPEQIKRITNFLYSMTAEETIIRLESSPKLNTQIGPMFNAWTKKNFKLLTLEEFQLSHKGIFVLAASEEDGKIFVQNILNQNLSKRPDFIAKINSQYIIGEAKWIGQPGGNQEKQVQEVLHFCKNQRGNIKRVGIVDGFPWAVKNKNGNLINNKEAVLIQESEYDILSVLLLKDYLNQR